MLHPARDRRPSCRAAAVRLAGAVGIAATSATAAPPSYDAPQLQVRSNIVDGFNLPPGSSFNSGTPSLNDAGDVSIRCIVVGGTGQSGIWLGNDGVGGIVYQPTDDSLVADVDVDPAGDLVFERFDVTTFGILRHDASAGTTTTIVDPGGPFGVTFFSDPEATADGRLGVRGGNFTDEHWIRWDDGVQTSLVAESDPGIGFLFVPRTAAATGQVAGKVRLGSTAGSNPDEIRRYDDVGVFTVLAVDDDGDPASPFTGFDNGVEIAPNGAVAFIASLAGGGRGVFRADDDGIVTIATLDDAMVSEIAFFRPAINDAGLVAFRGEDGNGLDAVFVGDGGGLIRLVGEHDLIDTDLGLGRIDQNDGSITFGGSIAINAHGDVAFSCTLTPAENNQIEWGSGVFVARAIATEPDPDLDGDGDVDFQDLLALLAGWGGTDPALDLDQDGAVGFGDLLVVLGAWTG